MSPLLFLTDLEWGFGISEPVQVYPERERQLSFDVPTTVRAAFTEAQACLCVKAYTASTIMSRRVLEAIVRDQGHWSRRNSLAENLAKMRDAGQMDPRLARWADAIRLQGNDGAHGGNAQIDRDDAVEVLGFAEALIDYLYVFQQRYDSFMRRRELLAAGKNPDALETFAVADVVAQGVGSTAAEGPAVGAGVTEGGADDEGDEEANPEP